MALVIGENSFVTLEEAQSIATSELYSDSPEYTIWSKLSDSDKEKVCKKGTMALNTLEYIGRRNVYSNKLKFPRVIDGIETIPEEIKIATVINGILDKMYSYNEQYKLIKNGVKSMSVGPNSVSLDTTRFQGLNGAVIYDEAKILIRKYMLTCV